MSGVPRSGHRDHCLPCAYPRGVQKFWTRGSGVVMVASYVDRFSILLFRAAAKKLVERHARGRSAAAGCRHHPPVFCQFSAPNENRNTYATRADARTSR
jgi:hypothetical protein